MFISRRGAALQTEIMVMNTKFNELKNLDITNGRGKAGQRKMWPENY